MKSILALSATAALLASSALASGHDSHDRQALHRRAAQRQAGWVRRNKPLLLATPNTTVEADESSAAPAATSAAEAVVVNPTYNGTALWFEETGATGACLKVNTDDDLVVGLPDTFWPETGVVSEYCGKQMLIRNTDNNKTVTVTVADASGKEFTTLTRAAFLELSPLRIGMIPIEFQFLDASVPVPAALASSIAAAPSSSDATSAAASGVFNETAPAIKVLAGSSASVVEATTTPVTTAVPTVTPAPTSTVDSASAAAASKASAEAAAEASEQAAEKAAASSSKAAFAASREAVVLAAQHSSEAAEAASSSRAAAAAASSQAAAEAAASSSAAAAAASSQAAAQAAASASAAAAAASSKAAAEAAASSSAAAAAAASAKASASSSSVYTGGIATYFFQNGIAGNGRACGKVNSDSTLLVALPTRTYAGGSHCGKTVTIKRLSSGKTISALVADSCPTCENDNCLDLSEGAYQALGGTVSEGVFDIEWWFN